MTDLDLFNAARAAGLPPHRAARYVAHVRLRESQGRQPLTPESAAASPVALARDLLARLDAEVAR